MADYAGASRTKDYFESELLANHPEIVSIAPRQQVNEVGEPTGVGLIYIGVRHQNPIKYGPEVPAKQQASVIPDSLPSISLEGIEDHADMVEVVLEYEGEITLESHTAKLRPCPGGYSVGHFSITAGTLGGVARVGSQWGYILSNNHILAAQNAARIGDAIYQPGPIDGGTAADRIASLERFVPVDTAGRNNEVDCAFARALEPWDQYVIRNVQGIGTPTAVADATVNQEVRKSGRTTELTFGRILSTNATVRLAFGGGTATFINQLQYSRMSAGGDSGSLIFDRNSLTAVGLNFAGSSSASYGNKITRVLELLSSARTIFAGDGTRYDLEEIELSLT